jgi:uncharacterized membrane protein
MSTIKFNIKLSHRLILNIWILTTQDGNMTSWYIWIHDVKYKFDIVVLHGIFLVLKFDKTPRNKKNEYDDQIKMPWFWMLGVCR